MIVAPNRDTLYSIAVLDLRSEPMVLTLPAVDRPLLHVPVPRRLDGVVRLRRHPGHWRAGGHWVITPPGWEGDATRRRREIESPTPQVFLLGRFLVDDDADIAASPDQPRGELDR